MKATMVRKASSGKEWLEIVARCKHKPVEVKIEKSITLTPYEFDRFTNDLLEDQDFIKENQDLMRIDENEVWHCIEVKSKSSAYSIIVESEGYDYARYTAIRVR